MNVFHIVTGLSTGGAERALYNLLSGALGCGDEHMVLSLRDEGTYGARIRALGATVYTLGMQRGLPGPAAIVRLRALAKKTMPAVVHGWMYHGNLAASVVGWLAPNRPAVAWNVRHSLYSLAGEKPLTRQVIRVNRGFSGWADAIVYNSRLSRRQHEAFGFATGRGRVIPNGFDLETFQPSLETCAATRRTLDIPEDALVVGHVARFHPMKDHVSFLRAAVQVAGQMPRARFLLAGREANLGNPRLAGIVPPELVDRFHFLGERDDVAVLMQAMDVFCQSSWSEAFPNVLGEAMACGVPCVATDVGDSADIVRDTGIVVPPSESDAIAEGLSAMLMRSDDERRALGRAARARVEANYALPEIVTQYVAMYKRLVQDKRES